jgi:hypothetical protein
MSIIGVVGSDYLAVRSFRRRHAQNLPPFSSWPSRRPDGGERVYHGGIHPGAPVLSPLPVTVFTLASSLGHCVEAALAALTTSTSGLWRNDFLDCALGTYTAVEVG